jgi:hypothetical protein
MMMACVKMDRRVKGIARLMWDGIETHPREVA